MRRAKQPSMRAGVAWAALALSLSCGGVARGQEEAPPPAQIEPAADVGTITVAGEPPELARHALELIGRVVALAAPPGQAGWVELAAGLSEPVETTMGWSIELGAEAGVSLRAVEEARLPVAQSIAFDVVLDCNVVREGSPQPFSHTPRGRALDALTIDNARRARLTGVYADPSDTSELTIVLFTESRAQAPGRWRAMPLATVRMAPTRGDPEPPLPVEFNLGERWGGVVFATADLALGLDPENESRSTEERFREWGLEKAGALRSLSAGFDGRVWLWPGAGGKGFVCSLPVARGWTDRRIADAMRTIFARRLAWGRDESGRATATLALVRENRPAEEGDRTLSMRFISIADRMTLTIATNPLQLNDAAETLADISR